MASGIDAWVNDKLHDILGISDKYIAQYFVGLASKSDSPGEFIQKLKDTGTVDIDENLSAFASELFNKVRRWYISQNFILLEFFFPSYFSLIC